MNTLPWLLSSPPWASWTYSRLQQACIFPRIPLAGTKTISEWHATRAYAHLLDLLWIEFALPCEFAELAHVLGEELSDTFAGDGFAVLAFEGISERGDDVRWVLRSWRRWRVRRVRGHRVSAVVVDVVSTSVERGLHCDICVNQLL